jgi:Hypoxia induced protein conserved region
MSGLFLILVPLALAAVVLVLGLGLYNMARGGSPQRSQEFMRWRVILQLVALIVIMLALYFATR